MPKYRVWFFGLALSLLVSFAAAPASAWEAKLTANYTNDYFYLTQTGPNGFFGPYDVDNSVGSFAHQASSLNFWGGDFAQAIGTVSGSEAAWNGMFMTLDPDIYLNPAVRLRGRYYIGSWYTPYPNQNADPYVNTSLGSLVASEYFTYQSPGVQRSFSPGYWNLLWLTVRLPWGEVAVGKRPSSFGTGLAWDGTDNRSSESFNIVSNYGPFRIAWSTYLSREGDEGYFSSGNTSNNARYADKNNKRYWDSAVTLTYRAGALDMGVLCNYVFRHRGPERRIAANKATFNATTHTWNNLRDRTDFYGGIYAKLNNGRFFANTEFDWYDRVDRNFRQASNYVFDYRAMGEIGLYSGPAKFSVLVSWHSGMDRRFGSTTGIVQGCLGDPQTPTSTNTNPRVLQESASNTGLYRPYSYIMVYGYGLGNAVNTDTGEGYVKDAFCKAARLDYAVAANLNVFGSFFQANRVGNGYGWGYLKPAPMSYNSGTNVFSVATPNGSVSGSYRGFIPYPDQNGNVNSSMTGAISNVAPAIPDNDLGWEVDAGFEWKLLENFTVRTTWGYWQPGKWFSFACISKSNTLWQAANGTNPGASATPTGIGFWGTVPDRSIDPVMALNVQLLADF